MAAGIGDRHDLPITGSTQTLAALRRKRAARRRLSLEVRRL
jgi:hypothetical protein